ncbi:CRISPR-associated helicase Cas3' [Fibrella arboris]|uniref:CRISPR-associated helicase Cas3' n=1 Tax=Fibrella arboris TaxID=3242486 RepID=UPI0035221725
MIEHLLAKTKDRESLGQHTGLVLNAWQSLYDRYADVLGENEDFWFDSFVAALFHDFGKASLNFQNMLLKALGEPVLEKGFEPMRHEFLSGMLLAAHTALPTRSRKDLQVNSAQLFAVFTHHKDFKHDLFADDFYKQWKVRNSDAEAFFAFARDRVKAHFPQKQAFLNDIETAWNLMADKPARFLYTLKDKFIVEPILRELHDKREYDYRRTYLLQKSLLVIADWTASGHRELEQSLQYDTNLIRQKVADRVAKAGGTFDGFRDFQTESGQTTGNILAIAPTGSGKTEAALLWASQREGFEKIVYLLPTRVTANALYLRLNDCFGKANNGQDDYTAVVHSSAKLFRLDLDEHYDNFNYLREAAFFKPVTVATVDQLLTQGFNLGWWEMKTFHLFRARVILDEIHAYAPYTLGLIVASIRYLRRNFQTQFYVMTATMPEKLQRLLASELGEVTVLRDKELLEKKRNVFHVTNKSIDQLRPDIEGDLQEGKKVLIVVNTVDEAIRLYDQYDGFKRMCYHSRFIVKDRADKERTILDNEKEKPNEGFLLIATQVVEVSLDIDYQCLYTENAPIDAIIQRAGRVNRKRGEVMGKVVVFPHSENAEKHIYDSPFGILSSTFNVLTKHQGEALSEQDLLQMVEDVYKDWNVEDDEQYQSALSKYESLIRTHCNYLYDFSNDLEQVFTREGLDTVNVIPNRYQAELSDASILEKSKHEVAVRIHRVKANKPKSDSKHSWFQYFDCDYDFEHGLRFKKKDNAALTNFF